jgi:hypothetical protein
MNTRMDISDATQSNINAVIAGLLDRNGDCIVPCDVEFDETLGTKKIIIRINPKNISIIVNTMTVYGIDLYPQEEHILI